MSAIALPRWIEEDRDSVEEMLDQARKAATLVEWSGSRWRRAAAISTRRIT